jgi:hypothetical protein
MHGVTPFYMAPELATPQGKPDARSDIYELGATYYHMVTGQPPFQGNSPLQILMRMAQEEATPPRTINPGIPAPVAANIQKMMAPEPGDRYQAVDALIKDLDNTASLETWAGESEDLKYPASEAVPEGVPGKPVPVSSRRAGRAGKTGRAAAHGTHTRHSGLRRREKTHRGTRRSSAAQASMGGEDEGERRPHRPAARGGSMTIGLLLFVVFLIFAAAVIVLLLKKRQELQEEQQAFTPGPAPVAPAAPQTAPGPPPSAPEADRPSPQPERRRPQPDASQFGRSLLGPGGALEPGAGE